jgi:hypothetical protein
LDRLEAQVGDSGDEDFGPSLVVRFTRYWRSGTPGGVEGEESEWDDQFGARRERMLFDAAVAEVRAEAKARRQRLGVIHVIIGDDGRPGFSDVPWRPVAEELAWTHGLFAARS